jgi:hypothetical protein
MAADLASRSLFRVQDRQIVPQQFTADDGKRSDKEDQQLNFDWARGRVIGIAERKPVDIPIHNGLLDKMSVQVAVMLELQAGRTPRHFQLVDKGRIKDYDYSTEGTTTLRTSMGEHRTVIFRSNQPGSRKGTWFWCAPDLGYIPLKVEGRDGKDVQWSMIVKSFTIGDAVR